jgi:hypothetical protein
MKSKRGGHCEEIGDDLEITRVSRQAAGPGTWVLGRLNGHRFDALVFPALAENPAWELPGSRIAKLWVQRLANQRVVFRWDRGPDVPAADARTAALVDFLAAGLADYVFAR